MAFRFRRSIKLFPGARLNFGKKGFSVRLGVKGLGYTVGTSGSRVTAGVPGTGISYTEKIGKRAPAAMDETHILQARIPHDQSAEPASGGIWKNAVIILVGLLIGAIIVHALRY